MNGVRVVGWVAVVVLCAGTAGCGSDDGGGKDAGAKPAASPTATVPSVDEALDAYTAASAPGCETAPECQELMTAELAAAKELRKAMAAQDADKFAEPIDSVDLAVQRADHYGADNLGAKGNSFAVSQPLQQMVAWFREHPGA